MTQLLNYNNGGQWKVSLTKGVTGEGWTLENNPVSGSSVNYMYVQNWNLDANGRAASRTGYVYSPFVSGSSSYMDLATINQRWSGDRLAARSSGTDRRWEYRYNARSEVATAWQQSNKAVTAPLAGEPLAGTAVGYAYDDIGNRLKMTEAGKATSVAQDGLNLVPSSMVTLEQQRVHDYAPPPPLTEPATPKTPNAAN